MSQVPVPFPPEFIVKGHSLNCHYKCDCY